jgi:hypothetical protein
MDAEKISPQFESEVAQISMEIEERRNKLEKEAGIESHEQVAKEVIREAIQRAAARAPTTSSEETDSYLDSASPEDAHHVNELIDLIYEKGLTEAVKEAQIRSPYILDAFHDALVEKLYNTLKSANYI